LIFSTIATLQVFSEPTTLRPLTNSLSSTWAPLMKIYRDAFVRNDIHAPRRPRSPAGDAIVSFGPPVQSRPSSSSSNDHRDPPAPAAPARAGPRPHRAGGADARPARGVLPAPGGSGRADKEQREFNTFTFAPSDARATSSVSTTTVDHWRWMANTAFTPASARSCRPRCPA
jgi:hypothetical protein